MDRPSPGTRSCNISVLLNELHLKFEKTARFSLTWDQEVEAGKIDLKEGSGKE